MKTKTRRVGRRNGEGVQIGDVTIRCSIKCERGKGRRMVMVFELPPSLPIILLDKKQPAADDVK